MAAFSFLALQTLTDSQIGTVTCLGGSLFEGRAHSRIYGKKKLDKIHEIAGIAVSKRRYNICFHKRKYI